MELLENWNRAISYLEDHLEDQVDMEEAAALACCSLYHFQRMFSYMTDITVSEYIRRRKMSMAAAEAAVRTSESPGSGSEVWL